MDTLELLVRTHFTLVAAEKGTMLKDVIGYGSGFMMSYKGYKFFVTAAHVNEPTWSTRSEEVEIKNNDIAIATHLSCEQNGVKQTVYVPIGDFLYVNEFKVDPSNFDFPAAVEEAERNPVPVDVAVALVKERPGIFTYSDDISKEVENADWEEKSKIIFPYEAVVDPDKDDHYFVFGRIKFEPRNDEEGHTFIYSEPRFHVDMEYISNLSDHVLCFKATEDIDYDEWAGISGAPILNPEGYIVGIASSVFEGTPYMFGLDINIVRPFFDILIQEETGNSVSGG